VIAYICPAVNDVVALGQWTVIMRSRVNRIGCRFSDVATGAVPGSLFLPDCDHQRTMVSGQET
jgi:hypothetical protein